MDFIYLLTYYIDNYYFGRSRFFGLVGVARPGEVNGARFLTLLLQDRGRLAPDEWRRRGLRHTWTRTPQVSIRGPPSDRVLKARLNKRGRLHAGHQG